MMVLSIDDVAHLPELEFEDTRKTGKPIEWGMLAPVRRNPDLVQFEPEEIIFGYYRDAKTGNHFLIHAGSLRPYTGFPEASGFDGIREYKRVRPYDG